MMELEKMREKRICVAVSGGADSMSLLFYLKNEEKKGGFFLSAVSCEHGIRGTDSIADLQLVEEYCKKLDVPLSIYRADCKAIAKERRISIETAARIFRRGVFEEILQSGKADYIATAHHEGDEAETVLFHLCRGASLSGAKGMQEIEGNYFRPFLKKSKQEILEYVKANRIPYRDDKSNFETDATRNYLRLEILPKIEKVIPGARRNLARFAALAAEDDEYLYAIAKKLIKKVAPESKEDTGIRVSFCLDKPILKRAALIAMKEAGIEKDYTSVHLENIYALQSLQTGSEISLPCKILARKVYDEIAFFYQKEETENKANENEFLYQVQYSTINEESCDGLRTLRADKAMIPKDAVIRYYKEGDAFKKYGGGTKSLKKYFIDKKISSHRRSSIPLIAEKDGNKIYAVCGVEISDDIKITEQTKEIVYIIIRKE